MRRGILSLILGVVVALGLLAWSVMYSVGEHEVAVVYRLNRYHGVWGIELAEKGLNFKFPYPFDTIRTLDTRIQVTEYPDVQVMTGTGETADQDKTDETAPADTTPAGDGTPADAVPTTAAAVAEGAEPIGYESIVVSLSVGWEVVTSVEKDGQIVEAPEMARIFVEKNGGTGSFAEAERNLKTQVDNARQGVFSSYPLDAFVTTVEGRQKFAQVEREMIDRLNERTVETFGIRVKWVRISSLGFPKSTITTVEEFMKTDRRRVSEDIKNKGIVDANQIRSDAEKARGTAVADAEAEALKTRATADAAAAKHYEVFQKYPELAGFFTKLDALATLKERLTLVIDPDTPPFDILAKPLRALVEKAPTVEEGDPNE